MKDIVLAPVDQEVADTPPVRELTPDQVAQKERLALKAAKKEARRQLVAPKKK